MDNKINEIRRKISSLRSEMLSLEHAVRAQVDRVEDCSEAAGRLMDMREQMVALIGQRDALGGRERMLNVEERLKADYRVSSPKPNQGRPGSPWMNLDLRKSWGLEPRSASWAEPFASYGGWAWIRPPPGLLITRKRAELEDLLKAKTSQ